MTTTGIPAAVPFISSCTSNPLTCGMRMSSTTQCGRRRCSETRKSVPDEKVSTSKRAERISRPSALRTDSSSSTTAMSDASLSIWRTTLVRRGARTNETLVQCPRRICGPSRPQPARSVDGVCSRETGSLDHAHELRHRAHVHLLHAARAMDLDGLLRGTEIGGDLLVQAPRHDVRE